MVDVYKVLKAVDQVNVCLHSINTTPPGTGTLKDISGRLKMEAVLLYMTFGELPKPFVMGSDEGRGPKQFGQVAGEQAHNLILIGFFLCVYLITCHTFPQVPQPSLEIFALENSQASAFCPNNLFCCPCHTHNSGLCRQNSGGV